MNPDTALLRYSIPVLLSIALALAWPVASHIRSGRERQRYWTVQGLTLIGAVLGAKLVVLTGDRFWPVVPLHAWSELWTSGRSIVGGLIFGFLAAEAAKPLLGYTLPPNDRFAVVIPFSVATGRVGCLLDGCCRGLPYDGWIAIAGSDGVLRYPSQLIEMLFHAATGVTFLVLVRRGLLPGRIFAVYLMAYGVFRFLTEFLRVTPRIDSGLSVYQLWCVVMVILGALSYRRRRSTEPEVMHDGQ